MDSALALIQHVASKHKLQLCENLTETPPSALPPPPPYPSYYPPFAFPSSFPLGLRAAFPSPVMDSYLYLSEQKVNPYDLVKKEVEEERKPSHRVFQPYLDPDKESSLTSERSRSAELSTGSFEPELEEEAMDGVEESAEDLSVRKRSMEREEEREEGVTSTSLDSLDVLKQHLKLQKLPAMEPSAMKALVEKGRLDALLNPEVIPTTNTNNNNTISTNTTITITITIINTATTTTITITIITTTNTKNLAAASTTTAHSMLCLTESIMWCKVTSANNYGLASDRDR